MGPNPNPRAIRATLLWGLAFFAGLQLGLFVLTETRLASWRDPILAIRERRLQRRLASATRAIPKTAPAARPRLLVALGSSHVLNAVDTPALERHLTRDLGGPCVAYNLATPGGTPLMALLTLKHLLAEQIRPDVLLVEAFTLARDDDEQMAEIDARAETLSWRDRTMLEEAGFSAGLRPAWWQAALAPSYSRRAGISSAVLPALLPADLRWNLTWARRVHQSGAFLIPDSFRGTGTEPRTLVPPVFAASADGLCSRAMTTLLETAQRHQIAVILLVMPESPKLRGHYLPGARPSIVSAVDRLSRRYRIPVAGAREWFDEPAFLDGHHLLQNAASCYTERLTDELLLPLLGGRSLPSGYKEGEAGSTPEYETAPPGNEPLPAL